MAKLKANQFEYRAGLVITERPILFQTDMVQAILEDRKKQTRREVKLDTGQLHADQIERFSSTYFAFKKDGEFVAGRNCKYGKPGDLLWVKETWCKMDGEYFFKSIVNYPETLIWKPSIHMPKDACRIWLMVEEVRVERVQDISEEDAIDEGLKKGKSIVTHIYRFLDYQCGKYTFNWPSSSFQSLWKFINGEESWDSNPWVWVIKFRVLSKTGRPSREEILSAYDDVTSECNANEETASPDSRDRSDASDKRKEVGNG